MIDDELLKLDNQLCFAAYSCSRQIIKLYKPYLEKLGLTYTQYITLLVLWEKHSITVKKLGDTLYLDSGTLTPLLKKLEVLGIIEKIKDPQDDRSVIVNITKRGMELKNEALDIPKSVFCSTDLQPYEAVYIREKLKEITNSINNKINS